MFKRTGAKSNSVLCCSPATTQEFDGQILVLEVSRWSVRHDALSVHFRVLLVPVRSGLKLGTITDFADKVDVQ